MPNTPPLANPSSPNALASANARIERYVMDSHALFALLQKEKGHESVVRLIERAEANDATLYLSLINWGEIFYIVEREQGVQVAEELAGDIDTLPIVLSGVDRVRVESAAHIKSKYAMSYADAFAVALARELDATLVTGDPEFKAVEKMVSVLWLENN